MHKSLAALVIGLVACGPAKGPEGPSNGGGGGGGGGPASKPMGPGDVAFEVQQQDIKGTVFEPDAIGWPDMAAYDPKKPTTIEKQRATYEKTKELVQKQAYAAVLATMLYRKAKDAKGDEQKQLYNDARQVLRDVQTAAGDKVDEITLRLLGTYDIMLGDYAEAEKEWGDLVKKTNAKDKELPTIKTWSAYSLLMGHKNSEALAALDAAPSEKNPSGAYIAGWAKWRTGDAKGAIDALLVAAKGWGTNPGKETLQNELLLMAGRSDMTVDATVAALTPVFGKMSDQQYTLLFKLGVQAYLLGGRWADGVSALEKAKAAAGAKVPPNDKVSIPFKEADYTIRLDDPVVAAKYATESVNAIASCGAKCPDKDKATLVEAVYQMGRLFHVIYATSHDDRYYQPARDLYGLTLTKLLDDAMRKQATADADALERSFKGMKAGVGTHDKGFVGAILVRHNQEVTVCYEAQLAANPKLGGTLTLNLESDQTGVIKGVSTEPKGGAQDMAAVASCVEAKAKSWKLPTRAQAGSTRIKASYSLSPAKQ